MAKKVIKEVFFIMKKYLLVSLTILFAAAFVWAADATVAEPKVDVDANATLSWGVDLGKGDKIDAKHGFENKASWAVKFPLIKKGNAVSTKSDVPVYGEVILKDIELDIVSKKGKNGDRFGADGKVGGLSAKLWFYGAYMTVFDKPNFKANYAKLWDPIDTDDFDANDWAFAPKFNGAGFKVGYANKDLMGLDVGLKLGSNGDWKSKDVTAHTEYYSKYFDGDTKMDDDEELVADAPIEVEDRKPPAGWYFVKKAVKAKTASHSKYGIGLDLSMKPLDKMLGIGFTVNSTLTHAKTYIDGGKENKGYNTGVGKVDPKTVTFNFGIGITSEPIDGLSLKFGFDGGSKYDTGSTPQYGFAWDTSFDAGYKWVSGGVYVSSPGTKMAGTNKEGKSITDLAAYVKFETAADKDDASNLVEGLDAGAFLGLYHLLSYSKTMDNQKNQLPMLLKVWGAYKVNVNDAMWIKPFADIWVETNNYYTLNSGKTKASGKLGVAYDLGVTYSPVEKVEVTAKWQHGTINENHYFADAKIKSFVPFVYENKTTVNRMNDKGHKGRFVLSLKVIY